MKTRLGLTLIALAAILSLLLIPVAQPDRRPSQIELAQRVCAVELAGGSATCFPIAELFGCVAFLTCGHVIDALPEVVLLPNGDRLPVIFTEKHPKVDVGLIWTRANPGKPMPLIPVANQNPPLGSLAMFAGYPAGLPLWLSQGLVGSRDAEGDNWSSVPLYYGGSGGPAFVDGQVVGVGRGLFLDGFRRQAVSNMTVFVMVDQFRDWLNECLPRGPSVK